MAYPMNNNSNILNIGQFSNEWEQDQFYEIYSPHSDKK